MSIEISRETAVRLAAEARRRGISIETLLEHVINDCAALTHPAQPELPV